MKEIHKKKHTQILSFVTSHEGHVTFRSILNIFYTTWFLVLKKLPHYRPGQGLRASRI